MKKKLFVGVIAVLMLIPIAGMAPAYDKEFPDKNPIGIGYKDSFTYLRVMALGIAYGLVPSMEEDRWILKEGFWSGAGSGTVVAAGFVLTAAHVVNPMTLELPTSEVSSFSTFPFKMLTRTVMLYDYKDTPIMGTVIWEDTNVDIALIQYNHRENDWLKPVPFRVAGPKETFQYLEKGDAVCGVVHQRDENGSIAYDLKYALGTVMDNGPISIDKYNHAWLSPFDITLYVIIVPGDSGSPLFAFDHGQPVLIGVLRAHIYYHYTYYSYAARLPVVDRFLLGRR